MIQRLPDALRVLAADAETQLADHRHWLRPEALPGELADAIYLVDSCQQERIPRDARDALADVEALLETMSAPERWTDAALRGDPVWREVRLRAGAALRLLEG